MDNSVSVISSLAALSLVAILAFQCVQNNIEGFTEDEARAYNARMAATASQHPSEINQALDNSGIPSQENMDTIQNANFNPVGSPNILTNMALNQPAASVATNLLPSDSPSKWGDDTAPVTSALANQTFLSAHEQIGVNTTVSSFKNPSIDLRGDPVCNPREPVTVFNNSSITCTFNRPLTCYEELPRPNIWSCNWNEDAWRKLDGK